MSIATQTRTVDLRDSRCPVNCVEAMAILEETAEGSTVEFWIAADTVLDIPRMLHESGHAVLDVRSLDSAGTAILVLRRPKALGTAS